jgi:ABC-type glycerol-3-phosphate transport system substrate-binding protein
MHRLILIILLLAFLTACRDAPGPDTIDTAPAVTQTEQVTITLAVEGSSLNRYRPLIEAFEEENPAIQVRLVSLDEVADPNESGIRALATSFDVFPYSPNRQGESQYLLDLRPLRDLDPQFDTADFLPGLLPPTTEPLWAIPTGAAYYLTFYDQSAFEAANLLPPELDWTTDDFLDAALALTAREGDEVTQWGYVPGQLRYPPLLAGQLTGPLTTPDGGLRLADPDVVAAVQWLSDLFTVHEVSPWLEEYKPVERRSGSGGQSALALIDGGMVAMWHTTHLLFDADKENVGVTAVPHGPHGLAAEPILYGFAASRGTAHPEAAWQLLHFLSRQPSQEAWAGLITPARRSVAVANSYWEQLPDNLAPALQYTAENNSPPRITFQAANLLQEAIAVHIDDDVPAAVALGQLPPPTAVSPDDAEPEIVVVPTAVTDDDDEEERIRIIFSVSYGATEPHRRLVNQFQQENPAIAVHVPETDNTPGISLLDRVAGSDCFMETNTAIHDAELRAAILPLTPLLELDGSLQIDDFYALPRSYLIEDGELLALPAFVVVSLIEYNRDLFREAGVPEPALDWTLDDFLEIAQQMTWGEGETKQYGYDELLEHLVNTGRVAFDVQYIDHGPGIPTYDYQAAFEMITWYADLIRLYEVQPPPSDSSVVNFSRFESLLRAERLAMWPAWASNIVIARENIPLKFEIGTVSHPLGPSGSRGDLTVGGYYIMADSPHRQACWEWIKFLARHPQATNVKFNMPVHIQTAESAEYMNYAGEEITVAARAFLESSNPGFRVDNITISWFYPGSDWLREAYREIVNGDTDVATALANAEVKFSQYRQCIIEREAFDDNLEQLECVGVVDPALKSRYTFRP